MIDAISNELPLLLSKDAMKKANTTTDFMNDKVNILGQGIGIGFTNSGHYSIQYEFNNENCDSILLSIDRNYRILQKTYINNLDTPVKF